MGYQAPIYHSGTKLCIILNMQTLKNITLIDIVKIDKLYMMSKFLIKYSDVGIFIKIVAELHVNIFSKN